MAVNIQGEGCGGMSQVALNGFDIISGSNSGNGIAMSQVMKASVRPADTSGGLLKGSVNGGLCDRGSGCACKYQVALLPQGTGEKALLCLFNPLVF